MGCEVVWWGFVLVVRLDELRVGFNSFGLVFRILVSKLESRV